MHHRLLLVEDDAPLAGAMMRLLSRSGYEVFSASSCAEALQATGPFDLGIFDLDLPDGDGVELSRLLRSSNTVRSTVYFSGSVDPARCARASQMGPFVEKYRGVRALLRTVESLLPREASRQAVGAEDHPVRQSTLPPPSGVHSSGRGE